jgi:hypothetical protein
VNLETYRNRILADLTEEGPLYGRELAPRLAPTYVLQAMQRDGLIEPFETEMFGMLYKISKAGRAMYLSQSQPGRLARLWNRIFK